MTMGGNQNCACCIDEAGIQIYDADRPRNIFPLFHFPVFFSQQTRQVLREEFASTWLAIRRISLGNFSDKLPLSHGVHANALQECDAGTTNGDTCCTSECKLTSVCSDTNSNCCQDCVVAPSTKVCYAEVATDIECKATTLCDGKVTF